MISNMSSPVPSRDRLPFSHSMGSAIVLYGAVCAIVVCIFTVYLVTLYARPQCPPLAMCATAIAWLLTFSICFLVPIDLLNGTEEVLNDIWNGLFWASFLLMWFILPFLSGYYDNGAFTVRSKIWASIKFNVVFYAVAGIIGAGFIIYLAAAQSMSMDTILNLLMLLSNIWGLVMLIILLGYGVVEVPRNLYYISNHADRLRHLQFEAVSIHHEQDETLDELQATLKVIKDLHPKVVETENDQFLAWYNVIQDVVRIRALEIESSGRTGHNVDSAILEQLSHVKKVTKKTLIRLHYHCKILVRHLTLVETQWRDLVDEVIILEEAIGFNKAPTPRPTRILDIIRWEWNLRFKRPFYKVAFVFLAICSLFIVVSEAVLLSPITPMSVILGNGIRTENFILVQMLSIGPMIYMSWCAYYALFKVRLSKLFYIGEHRTDECTLLLHATVLLRVSSPLALNFTKMLKVPNAAIEKLIGPATRIPFIAGSDFTDVFPLFIVGFALITFLNLIPMLMKCLRIQKYSRGSSKQSEDTDVVMQEGTLLITKEKRARGIHVAAAPALGRPGSVVPTRMVNGKAVVPASVRLAANAANANKPPPPRPPPRSTPPIPRSRSASPSPSPTPNPSRPARPTATRKPQRRTYDEVNFDDMDDS